MRTRGGGENTSGRFKLTVEFSMLFVQSFPSPPTKRGASLKLANFVWSHLHDSSAWDRDEIPDFPPSLETKSTDFLSFLLLKSLGNWHWPIVTSRGWRDNRQLLKMFCSCLSCELGKWLLCGVKVLMFSCAEINRGGAGTGSRVRRPGTWERPQSWARRD